MPFLAKYVSGTLVAHSLGESRKLKQAAPRTPTPERTTAAEDDKERTK